MGNCVKDGEYEILNPDSSIFGIISAKQNSILAQIDLTLYLYYQFVVTMLAKVAVCKPLKSQIILPS